VAVLVVHRLEVIDIDHQQREVPVRTGLQQPAQVPHQVALIVQARQWVDQRHLERSTQIAAQPVLVEFSPDLVARAGTQFVLVEWQHKPVISAEVKPAQDGAALFRLGNQQHRGVARGIGRAQ